MSHTRTPTYLFILSLAAAVLLAACSQPSQQAAPAGPPPPEAKYNLRVSAVWYPSPEEAEELRVDYWIQNTTREDVTFEFPNSGRVCGFIQTPAGEEVLRFPETTAQVTGTETLEAGIDRTFIVHVPVTALEGVAPGRYEVKAWLCGREEMFSWGEFFVHAESQ